MSEGPVFLIDGYNLLWRGFDFQAGRQDLFRQRTTLETQLQEYLRRRPEVKMILVYDGALFVEEPPRKRIEGLEIVYSRPPQTADQLIVEECRRRARSGAADSLEVVTSDVKDIVRQLGSVSCRHRTSEEFAVELEELIEKPAKPRTPGKAAARPKTGEKPRTISPREVREWLEIFSKPKKKR